MNKKTLILVTLGIFLVSIFSFTNPNSYTALLLTGVYIAIYLFTLIFIYVLFSITSKRKDIPNRLLFSAILAFIPILMLGLSSINGINAVDLGIAFAVPVIFVWYLSNRSSKS
jgi:hypothetical protein